jgi:hypothetical protein
MEKFFERLFEGVMYLFLSLITVAILFQAARIVFNSIFGKA